jgi:hypothetical protein
MDGEIGRRIPISIGNPQGCEGLIPSWAQKPSGLIARGFCILCNNIINLQMMRETS